MEDQQAAVIVKDLYKTFKLPHDQHSGLKQLIVNFNKRDKGYETQRVLNGISFDIKEGEFFGIVGRNGSGKSTLLKLLAGIYAPDKGLVQVNGSLTPFIELGVGFNPELTGRENVFLNGALLGFSRKEMEAMYHDIVEFAELEKFMDQKLKNYSSGMQVRLAFSIAIRADSDILLLDEVLAVGDSAFQAKCQEYFRDLKNNNKTVILVTHDMGAVEKFCDRAMLLNKGEIQLIGSPSEISGAYLDINRSAINESVKKDKEHKQKIDNDGSISDGVVMEKVSVENGNKESTNVFKHLDDINISINYRAKKQLKNVAIDIALVQGLNGPTYLYANSMKKRIELSLGADENINATLNVKNIFSSGVYYVVSSVYNPRTLKVYARDLKLAKIVIDDPLVAGVVAPEHTFEINKEEVI